MPFEDLAAFVRPGFDLPVLGRTYYVPPPNARDGAWLQALIDGVESVVLTSAIGAANRAVLDDQQERTAYQIALGTAYQQMVDAEVPWPVLKHAGWTAWMFWTRGQMAAERYWQQFGDGPGKAETTAEGDPNPTSGATPPKDPSTPSQD